MKVVQDSKTPGDNFTENNKISQLCNESFEIHPLIPKTDEKVIKDVKEQISPDSWGPGKNCTGTLLHRVTLLHGGTLLHGVHFCTVSL